MTTTTVLHLLKTWAYEGDEPDRVRRALWDAELRTLYRLGSTPGASDALVVLRDAGLDRATPAASSWSSKRPATTPSVPRC